MRVLLIFLMACGEPKGPIIGVQSGDDTGGSNIDAGLVFIEGGTYPLGEDDAISSVPFLGGDGDWQTVIPVSSFVIQDFYIDRYPFPGVAGEAWYTDGARHNTIVALDNTLGDFGRRVCTITELLFAAAGPENQRYPYGNGTHDPSACDPDDSNPAPIGTYENCRSPTGVHDFQVRSTWGVLDDQVVAALEGTEQIDGFPEPYVYAVWGGTSRTDTFYAPNNYGFHTHATDAEDRYLDDGFRVCAGPDTPTAAQDLAYDRWLTDALRAGSFEALFE